MKLTSHAPGGYTLTCGTDEERELLTRRDHKHLISGGYVVVEGEIWINEQGEIVIELQD